MGKQFKHLRVPDHWQQYWTRYPEGYTILEALINWVSQVDKMVDNINDWNVFLDDFIERFDKRLAPEVISTLYKMVDDGTMATIINENILGKKATIHVSKTEPTTKDSTTFWFHDVGDNVSFNDGWEGGS